MEDESPIIVIRPGNTYVDAGTRLPGGRFYGYVKIGFTALEAIGTDGYYMMVSGDSSVYTVDGQTVQALCLTARQLKADT